MSETALRQKIWKVISVFPRPSGISWKLPSAERIAAIFVLDWLYRDRSVEIVEGGGVPLTPCLSAAFGGPSSVPGPTPRTGSAP